VTVLVTGASGFLGTALVERLLARGESHVRCFLRPGSRRERLTRLGLDAADARVELFEGSLTSAASVNEALEGVDCVFHLAAAMRGSPSDIFMNTVVASSHLLRALSTRPSVKTVLVSSLAVYGVSSLPRGQLVDEATPLESHPEWRDPYSHAKIRQERLFWEQRERLGHPMVVLRPGVIYGPGGTALPSRVRIQFPGLFLHLGGRNTLPLSYLDNCAEAIVIAARHPQADGEAYNVIDDDLPSSREYLRRYRREVRRLRMLAVPYSMLVLISRAVAAYHRYSRGQLPAFFTPYRTAASWKGNSFSNAKLKSVGWQPLVPTVEGLSRTFAYLKSQHDEDGARSRT
jgi:nucleoside-diphosphate-sugar epimerase